MADGAYNWKRGERCGCGRLIRHPGDAPVKPEFECHRCGGTLCEECCDRRTTVLHSTGDRKCGCGRTFFPHLHPQGDKLCAHCCGKLNHEAELEEMRKSIPLIMLVRAKQRAEVQKMLQAWEETFWDDPAPRDYPLPPKLSLWRRFVKWVGEKLE